MKHQDTDYYVLVSFVDLKTGREYWHIVVSDAEYTATKTAEYHNGLVIRPMKHLAPRNLVMVDFDSTLFPLLPAMGHKYPECETWETLIEMCGGVPAMLSEFDRIMQFGHQVNYKPFEWARWALKQLRRDGFTIAIVTDRSKQNFESVERWLDHHDIPFDMVVRDKNKITWCLENGAIGLIDDNPSTIHAAVDVGLHVTSLAHPYSKDALESRGLEAHDSWLSLYGVVKSWRRDTEGKQDN